MKKNKLSESAKSAVVYTFATLFSRGLAIITVPIFTRMMTTTQIGTVNLYNSWYSLISAFATLSLTSGGFAVAMKEYAGDRDKYQSAVLSLTSIIAIIIACFAGKPSKSKSEEIIKDYLAAINDKSEDEFAKVIDTKGYIVYKEEGEKKFDKKYDDKKYIKNYLEDNNFDELSDAESSITTTLKNKNKYSSKEYSLEEITSIKKSSKSKKIKIIKAKLKVKSSYSSSSDTANLKLYVIKVDGKYKVINAEID